MCKAAISGTKTPMRRHGLLRHASPGRVRDDPCFAGAACAYDRRHPCAGRRRRSGIGRRTRARLARAADEASVGTFSGAPPGDPPSAWKYASLPNKIPTRFNIVDLGGTHVLKVEADDSYGNLIYALHANVGDKSSIAWRWRVDKIIDEADIRQRSGDDSPAKLCVFFAFDAAKLSFGERTRLAIAHTTTGQDVPTETLCYVWDNKVPVDTGLPNVFTKRIRMIVLESGTAKLGLWVNQKRNLVADYQRMFGDESEARRRRSRAWRSRPMATTPTGTAWRISGTSC